jgi:hypothetical protein
MAGWNTDTKDFAKAVAEFEGCQADLLDGVKAGDRLDVGLHLRHSGRVTKRSASRRDASGIADAHDVSVHR